MPPFRMQVVGPPALAALEAALAAAGLPTGDLREPGRLFLRFDDGRLAGFGGIEGDGPDRLLGSLVVAPDRRGAGLGTAVLHALERHAAALGTARVHLLTTTAEPFFKGRGYVAADRASAPPSISGAAEFASLCPASAAYLLKPLG